MWCAAGVALLCAAAAAAAQEQDDADDEVQPSAHSMWYGVCPIHPRRTYAEHTVGVVLLNKSLKEEVPVRLDFGYGVVGLELRDTTVNLTTRGVKYSCREPAAESVYTTGHNRDLEAKMREVHEQLRGEFSSNRWSASVGRWGVDFVWGQSVKVYELHGVARGRTESRGEPSNVYELRPGIGGDHWAIRTVYQNGSKCVRNDSYAREVTTKWETVVWLRCRAHSDPRARPNGGVGGVRGQLPAWMYSVDRSRCQFVLHFWMDSVCPVLNLAVEPYTGAYVCSPQSDGEKVASVGIRDGPPDYLY